MPGGHGSGEVPGERENHHRVPSTKQGPVPTAHVLSFPTMRTGSLWGTNRARTEKWPGFGTRSQEARGVAGVSTGATWGSWR